MPHTNTHQEHDRIWLMKECIAGNKKAHELFYHQYYDMLMAVVRKYFKDVAQAEEVLHNSFINIFKSLKTFEERGSFDGWMKKITFHCVSDYLRSNKKYRENTQLTEEEYPFVDSAGPKQSIDYAFYINLVHSLAENQKNVFLLYVVDGFSHKEISTMLDIPIGTSKWNLSEARKNLQEKIIQIQNHSNHGLE